MNSAMPRAYWNARGFAGLTDYYSSSPMNRRMPNGTSGGAGGRGR